MGRGRAGGSERLDDRDHAGAQALLLAGLVRDRPENLRPRELDRSFHID